MKLSRWLNLYSKNLLPVRQFEYEVKSVFNISSDESVYFHKQRESIQNEFSDYISDQSSFVEEQMKISQEQKKQILAKIYKKSSSQLNSLAHKQNLTQHLYSENSDHDTLFEESKPYQYDPTFTTRYLNSIDGREYLIIGTYHSLQECSVEVMNLFKQFDPDSVVLELCQDRFYQLDDANINEKTQPHRVYNDLEKDPDDLSFLLKSCEFQVGYEAAQRSKKGCSVMAADLNLYYIQNRSKYLRAQCTCNVRQIRDKNSPMKQVLSYFFFGLLPYIFRKLLGYKIDLNSQIIYMEKFLHSESRHCITNRIYYEREENIFNTLSQLSQGSRVFCIVGFSHLNHLNEMLLKREEILKAHNSNIQNDKELIDIFNYQNLQFSEINYEKVVARNKQINSLEREIQQSIKQYESQEYCAKLD